MKTKWMSKLFAGVLAAVLSVSSMSIGAAAKTVPDDVVGTGAQIAAVTTPAQKEPSNVGSSLGASAPAYRPIIVKSPGTYNKQATIKITSRKGATIYYTTDGSTPTTKSKKYTESFKIQKSCTVKAIAVMNGKASSVASAKYEIKVSKPEFSVAGGYYTKAQTVTITPMDSKTVMYYTTDGSTPTTKSTKYTGPIKISKYTVLKVRAYKSGCTKSDVVTQEYNIYKESSNTTTTSSSVTRKFKWNDGLTDWEYTITIRNSDYKTYYNKQNYSSTQGFLYNAYVTDASDDVWVKSIVDEFMRAADEYGYTEIQKLYMMVTFCQNITYKTDKASTGKGEFPKYPIVTLYDMEGDCEDTSILLVSMLRAAGYDTMMLEYDPRPGDAEGHMAAAVAHSTMFTGKSNYPYEGKKYYYIETTATGWQIGDIPEGYNYAKFWTIK